MPDPYLLPVRVQSLTIYLTQLPLTLGIKANPRQSCPSLSLFSCLLCI